MKATFRQIEHTADVAIEAEAPDLPGLFDRAAAGMFSLMTEGAPPRPREEHRVAVEGADLPELLVAFLRELAWLHAERGFLYAGARCERLDAEPVGPAPARLVARVAGEAADPARHAVVREIKAVTYHALAVERRGDGWFARVVFDV